MKRLTRKFKEGFKSYDYNNQDIDILLGLLDIILEMMTIVEMSDHDYIKKLSSFTRLLSSGYTNTIIEAAIIEDIYDTTIIPVLDYFEEKYSVKFVAISSKEIVNGIPHTVISADADKVLNISGEDISVQPFRDFLALSPELDPDNKVINSNQESLINDDIYNLYKFMDTNKDTDDPIILETTFNMMKDSVNILYNIYDNFTSGKIREHSEKYMKELIYLRNVMNLSNKYDDMSIQLLSDVIQSLCYSLIDELNKNSILPPSSVMLIELKFKSLEGIKYNTNSIV